MTSYIDNYVGDSGAFIKISPVKTGTDAVIFYAFITSFSDNMTSTWNEEVVYGRPDPIGTFQNTVRKIALGFDVPAANLAEAKKNLGNINEIKRYMYPTYNSNVLPASGSAPEVTTNALSLSKNPLVRIKFANLIHNPANPSNSASQEGLLGWIGSFNATPVIDMGMFSEDGNFYPKVYNVSIDFTPQHEFDLGFKPDGTPIDSERFAKFPYSGEES